MPFKLAYFPIAKHSTEVKLCANAISRGVKDVHVLSAVFKTRSRLHAIKGKTIAISYLNAKSAAATVRCAALSATGIPIKSTSGTGTGPLCCMVWIVDECCPLFSKQPETTGGPPASIFPVPGESPVESKSAEISGGISKPDTTTLTLPAAKPNIVSDFAECKVRCNFPAVLILCVSYVLIPTTYLSPIPLHPSPPVAWKILSGSIPQRRLPPHSQSQRPVIGLPNDPPMMLDPWSQRYPLTNGRNC